MQTAYNENDFVLLTESTLHPGMSFFPLTCQHPLPNCDVYQVNVQQGAVAALTTEQIYSYTML